MRSLSVQYFLKLRAVLTKIESKPNVAANEAKGNHQSTTHRDNHGKFREQPAPPDLTTRPWEIPTLKTDQTNHGTEDCEGVLVAKGAVQFKTPYHTPAKPHNANRNRRHEMSHRSYSFLLEIRQEQNQSPLLRKRSPIQSPANEIPSKINTTSYIYIYRM